MTTSRIRVLVVFALALWLAVPTFAQSTLASSTISTAGADCSTATRCADFDTSGVPVFALYLNVGTSGTFNWEASVDADSLTGGTWFAVTDDVDGTSSGTADGVKYFTVTGYRRFRVRASAISGDATVVAFRGVAGARAAVASVVPGTGATNEGKAEDAAHASGDTGIAVLGLRKDGAAQTTSADGDYALPAVDAYSAAFVRRDHPNRFTCVVAVSTATTLTAVGGSCAAPGAGLSLYVTDVSFGTSAAAGTAADSFPTLKSGTGGTCGTGTAVIWQALTTANSTVVQAFATPIKVAANNELCWIMTTAGSKTVQIHGFIAP